MQVVAVPMPLQEDPEVTLGALRWTMDHLHRPEDVIHIVHVIKCMVHKLEVFHGDCSFLSSCAYRVVPELNLRCRTQIDIKVLSMQCTHLQSCLDTVRRARECNPFIGPAGMPGTTFSFDDPGESHHESADVARAKAFIQHRQAPLC